MHITEIAAQNNNAQYPVLPSEIYLPLVHAKLAEIPAATHTGAPAQVRLTQAGFAEAAKGSFAPTGFAAPAALTIDDFVIETGVPLPEVKRHRLETVTKYPFAQLEIDQSFFVPKCDAYPDPYKTMHSAVTAQNAKYSKETEEITTVSRGKNKGKQVRARVQERKFVVRKDTKNGVEGARVARVTV